MRRKCIANVWHAYLDDEFSSRPRPSVRRRPNPHNCFKRFCKYRLTGIADISGNFADLFLVLSRSSSQLIPIAFKKWQRSERSDIPMVLQASCCVTVAKFSRVKSTMALMRAPQDGKAVKFYYAKGNLVAGGAELLNFEKAESK